MTYRMDWPIGDAILLAGLTAHQRTIVFETVDRQLVHQPNVENTEL